MVARRRLKKRECSRRTVDGFGELLDLSFWLSKGQLELCIVDESVKDVGRVRYGGCCSTRQHRQLVPRIFLAAVSNTHTLMSNAGCNHEARGDAADFAARPVTCVFETLHRWPLAVFLLDALGCLCSAVICLLFLASDCCIHSQSEPAQDAIRWSPHVLALATSRLFVRRFSGSAAVGTVDAWHRGSCWQPTTQYCLQTKVQHIRQVLFVLSLPSTDLLLWLRDISESEQHCSCVRAIFVNIEK